MKRKFKVLQIGGQDLENIISHKNNVEWDYLDVALFSSNQNYKQKIRDLLEINGQFDFIFVQTNYSEELIEVFNLVTTPYNTYIDQEFWDERFERTEIVKNYMIRPLKYDTQQTVREKIQAITFTGQYGDELYPKYCNVDSKFEGEVQYLGNKYLVLSGNFGDFL